MISAWTKHIKDQEAKEKFQQTVRNARTVLDRLYELLDEEEKSLDRSELDIKVFDQPNWENRQAFKNGQRSVLSSLKKLINLDQGETN